MKAYELLCLASESPSGTTAFEAFRSKYRTSKQPGKKVAGIYRQLRALVRMGLLREQATAAASDFTEKRFVLTPAGRAEGIAQRNYDRALRAPAFPRLAT